MKKFYSLLASAMVAAASMTVAAAEVPDNATSFTGNIGINLFGEISTVENAQVFIIPTGEGEATFALYNFSLAPGEESIGDIVIPGCTVTANEDGTISYAGHLDELSLGGGAITATDISVTGLEQPDGALHCDIEVHWNTGMDVLIGVTFDGTKDAIDPQPAGEAVKYIGLISIAMSGETIGQVPDSEIFITPTGDGHATFALYNFELVKGEGILGDIIIPDCTMTISEDGTIAYEGLLPHIVLGGGTIEADDITVVGTETNEGAIHCDIALNWGNFPITVTFDGQREISALKQIEAIGGEAQAEYFDLSGRRVANPEAGCLYIERKGNLTKKVLF